MAFPPGFGGKGKMVAVKEGSPQDGDMVAAGKRFGAKKGVNPFAGKGKKARGKKKGK
jgi:hypothetical protein